MTNPRCRWPLALAVLIGLGWQSRADEATGKKLVELAKKIDGKHAFSFTELTEDGPKLHYGLDENERFAVGSSFKLFILGRLIAEVNQKRRRLDNIMRLSPRFIGPPHSEMGEWPIDSPATLQTFALKMISVSDNTATDHLLHLLGRRQVEFQMARMGHSKPEVNRPLLFTREMTMIRDKRKPERRAKWKEMDEEARRKFLPTIADERDYDELDFDTKAFDVAEWYASPMDMARTLNWIRLHTRNKMLAHPIRGVMAVETKLVFDKDVWPYAGFKGGSEDQLIAGNWLLRHKSGRWFALNVAFNNPEGKVVQKDIAGVLTEMLKAIEADLAE